jgi:hypothetical protein
LRNIIAGLAIGTILSLSSCVVSEDLSIRQDGTYRSSFEFDVEDFFISVLEDFEDFMPEESEQTIMDGAIGDFETALENGGSIGNVALDKIDGNAYEGTFDFSDIQSLFSDLGAGTNQTILTKQGDTLRFSLSMDNYDQLVPVIPFLEDENFEAFGPTYNQGMSERDYLEMIGFMLGDEGPGAIEGSVITIRIETPGDIESFENGKKISDRTYEFSFPLIDFLLLAEPITFSVTWN